MIFYGYNNQNKRPVQISIQSATRELTGAGVIEESARKKIWIIENNELIESFDLSILENYNGFHAIDVNGSLGHLDFYVEKIEKSYSTLNNTTDNSERLKILNSIKRTKSDFEHSKNEIRKIVSTADIYANITTAILAQNQRQAKPTVSLFKNGRFWRIITVLGLLSWIATLFTWYVVETTPSRYMKQGSEIVDTKENKVLSWKDGTLYWKNI